MPYDVSLKWVRKDKHTYKYTKQTHTLFGKQFQETRRAEGRL